MKLPIYKSYVRNKEITHFIKKLKELESEALKRQEIFFAMNLKGLKKSKEKR